MQGDTIILNSPYGYLLLLGEVRVPNGTVLNVVRRTTTGGYACRLPDYDAEFGVPAHWAARADAAHTPPEE